METRITIRIARCFSSAGYRKDIPAGFEIVGEPVTSTEPDRFVCRVANTLMQSGWWVNLVDTKLTTTPDPEPTVTLRYTLLIYSNGDLYINGVKYQG